MKTERTNLSASNYLKLAESPKISENMYIYDKSKLNTNTNSIPTTSSPQYIFSPVLFQKQENRLKTNHTTNYSDFSWGLESPKLFSTPLKIFPQEIGKA